MNGENDPWAPIRQAEIDLRNQKHKLQSENKILEKRLAIVSSAAVDTDTPLDKTVKMLDRIMDGDMPSAQDAIDLRNMILCSENLRQPAKLKEQLLEDGKC